MLVTNIISLMALALVSDAADAPSRQTMTREIVRSCVAQVGTQLQDPVPSCACTAGWLSAQLDYRDFYVVGRIYRFASDPAGMETEVARLVRDGGYAAADILRVARFLQDSEAEMSAACGFLERQ
ncbi:hypothetical protein [Maricaulis sp.]|uniref:hypothetical protein n=1 Tax=Maricaulis sp. TaxID=1486257 RepID=UPI003A932DAA